MLKLGLLFKIVDCLKRNCDSVLRSRCVFIVIIIFLMLFFFLILLGRVFYDKYYFVYYC